MSQLYFLHGKESSPNGFRANYLRTFYPQIQVPSLPGDFIQRRPILAREIESDACLIGSSLGGLSALDYVRDHPHKVKGMVLLAPAVGFHDVAWRTPEILAFVEELIVPAGIPTAIIAARQDEVIPLAAIQALVARSPQAEAIHYLEVDDEHRLHRPESLAAMLQSISWMLAEVGA